MIDVVTEDVLERIKRSPARKAGAVLRYRRGDPEDSSVLFIVLEDRAEKDYSEPGTLCLIIEGEFRDRGPGDILHIRGIVDCADEEDL